MSVVDLQSRKRKRRPHLRKQLLAHVGGAPNFVQRQLIERAARLTLYVEMLDARSLKAGSMSDHDQKQYLAWSNSLVRVLRDLGIEAAAQKSRSLSDIVGSKGLNDA
jgi:hypothetical protein